MDDIYYLVDTDLIGPIDENELESRIRSGVIDSETPGWSPAYREWVTCSVFIGAQDETCFIEIDESLSLPKQNMGDPARNQLNLPDPRCILSLQLAADRDMITPAQKKRICGKLFKDPGSFTDISAYLHERALITFGQRQNLENTMKHTSVADRIGGYEVVEELGHGGMGTTYLARQISMDRIVALKVLKPEFSEDLDYIRRFEREARMAAKLNHDNIATAYEVGSDGSRYFMSMEYIDGQNVADMVKKGGPLPQNEAVQIVRQVLDALQHAHEHGMVHRDISARNIIVKPNGRVKLIDMGLTKDVHSESSTLTTTGITVGTPAYISPEQAVGHCNVDIRSDIYSLGCVFYELLTGKPPLLGATAMETLALHIHNAVPSVQKEAPHVSDLVALVLGTMTALDQDDRYQEPQEALDALEGDEESARRQLAAASVVAPVPEQLNLWQADKPTTVKIPVESREYVHLVATALASKLGDAGVDAEFQGYAQTVFEELVANAFDHGCKSLTEGLVEIRMELNEAFFRIEVIDPGPGFAAQETLDRIKREPLNRERRRGIMQVYSITNLLSYNPNGTHVKAVLYRQAEGSGIHHHEADGITYVEVKGKGDLALMEKFKRWVDDYSPTEPVRLCLMVRTDWVSSMFVGAAAKLNNKLRESGSAFSVWPEHHSCYMIMQQLGITAFAHVYESLDQAVMVLRYASLKKHKLPEAPKEESSQNTGKNEARDTKSDKQKASTRSTGRSHSVKRVDRKEAPISPGLLGWMKGLLGGKK